MTLGFSEILNGKPTFFIEKFWDFLLLDEIATQKELSEYQFEYFEKFGKHWDGQTNNPAPKLHTMRRDKSKRWKAGNTIHPVINSRTKNRFQFAPSIQCQSIQSVLILQPQDEESLTASVYIGNDKESEMPFYFKSKDEFGGICEYGEEQMLQLAINDGFASIDDFFTYFNEDERYTLIHFTGFKY